jgi:FkbM family methyltransferase
MISDSRYWHTEQISECSADHLRSALQELFLEPVSSVIERENSMLERLLAECGKRCVLFGAGSLGRQALAALREIGIDPVALTDNNPKLWGTMVEGVPLLSPADAARHHGKDAMFFITIRNENHWYLETVSQLECLGCAHVSSADPIAWRLPGSLQPGLFYDLPHKLYEKSDLVLRAGELWDDDVSRAEYLGNIRLRSLGDRSWFIRPNPQESYFLDDIFAVRPTDVFVDCGAFDGDTLRNLLVRQREWAGIEAVEADSNSFNKLSLYVRTLDKAVQDRIHLHQCAIGDKCGKVRFEDTGKAASTRIMNKDGGTVVDLMPIDMLFAATSTSIIKMDIEGSELAGLVGGRQVIERDHPILAICVYHNQEDICMLPLLMHDINPDYRMYLRTHGGDAIQTVAYAVPPHRIRTA